MAPRGARKAAEAPYTLERSKDTKDPRPFHVVFRGKVVITAIQEKYAREQIDLFNRMWNEKKAIQTL